jgi:tol-pal system protein YbgF
MKLTRAFRTSLASLILTLPLFSGVVWAMADVETRSQPGGAFQEASDEQNSGLELLKKMEFLQREVQELRGKVEEQNYQLQQLQDHQKKLYLDLDKRLREGSPSNISQVAPAATGITLDIGDEVPTAASIAPPGAIEGEEKAYQKAYQLVQNKDYDGALLAFNSVVTQFPQGKYFPNSQYWLGEIYLIKRSLDLASLAFTTVYKNYPAHPKAADSLLKLGYVEYAKGQWKQSQTLLEQVKTQFPGSTSAQLADARIQKMHHEGHL